RYRAALRQVDAAPGSIDARREVALSALSALRPREALRRLEELDLKSGLMRGFEGDYWFFASQAHHLLGEHKEELAAVRQMRQFYPAAPFALFEALRALAALGRIAEVDSMARAELTGSGHAGLIAFSIAGELMAHAHGTLLARILAAQGKVGAARAALEHWETRMVEALGTRRGLELDRASVLVRIGDIDRALKVLSEGIGLRAFPNSTTSWDGHAYP